MFCDVLLKYFLGIIAFRVRIKVMMILLGQPVELKRLWCFCFQPDMAHLCPVAHLLLADGERQVTQDAVSRVCCISQLPVYRTRLPTDIRLWRLHVGHHGVRSCHGVVHIKAELG